MKKSTKLLSLTLVMSAGFTMTSLAQRFNPQTHIGNITEEDVQDLNADLAEENILNGLSSSIAYDENTDTYYEDYYTKAGPGSWVEDENGWWYRMDDGTYYTKGWVRVDGDRYYFDENGYMKTGWIESGKYWYYADDSGVMVTGTRQIDGKSYTFNAYGIMQ